MSSTSTSTATSTPQSPSTSDPKPPPKLSNGIVLGPDGKPCRTCTDVSSLFSLSKSTKSSSKNPPVALPPPSDDCPPDITHLGRSTWTLLHSITASYPISPSPSHQTETKTFMHTFAKLYPCWHCAGDFQDWMKKEGNAPRVSSRDEFGKWMCEAHNAVNVKLGKKVFDCGRWEERWRTGWGDGRCDF